MITLTLTQHSKLVMRLFEHIQELVDDEESFVCILIDEVRGWVCVCGVHARERVDILLIEVRGEC